MQATQANCNLSKFPLASLRELVSLSIPITLVLFSGSLMGFCDRLFLAHDSLESLEGCVNASYLCQLFQLSLCFCTRTVQVFVAQCFGSKQFQKIGGYVWQMLWLSIFSMLATIPLSFLVESIFIKGAPVEGPTKSYFYCLMAFNFLFPFGAALSSFYIGQAKFQKVVWITLFSNVLNVILDPLLIFGIEGVIAPLGIFGAALATGLSQAFFCFVLFFQFMQKGNRKFFGTHHFHFDMSAFLECIKVGFPRLITKLCSFSSWLATAHLMTLKGGDYLLVLSIGSTIGLLYSFIAEAMGQAVITIASYIIGINNFDKLYRLIRSSCLFIALASIVLLIPSFIYPEQILLLFFTKPLLQEQTDLLKTTFYGLWVFFIAFSLNQLSFSLLSAAKDTVFKMIFTISLGWTLNYIPVLVAIGFWNWSAGSFYFVMSFGVLMYAVIYFARFHLSLRHVHYFNKEEA